MPPASPVLEEDRLLTIEEFLEMDDNDRPAELVRGRRIPRSLSSPTEASLTAKIAAEIEKCVRRRDLGTVFVHVAVCTGKSPDTCRIADIAFVREERLAEGLKDLYFDAAPDLVIDIISPLETWDEAMKKRDEYLAMGSKQVWIVTPSDRSIYVYPSRFQVEIFSVEEKPVLTCPDILPGFELKLDDVFEGIDVVEP